MNDKRYKKEVEICGEKIEVEYFNLDRKFIGIELDKIYFKMAEKRMLNRC